MEESQGGEEGWLFPCKCEVKSSPSPTLRGLALLHVNTPKKMIRYILFLDAISYLPPSCYMLVTFF